MTTTPLPPVVDEPTWRRQLDELRAREKAVTRELDAIAAERRRLPMWQDVPEGWPQAPTYSHWWSSERYARYGGEADR